MPAEYVVEVSEKVEFEGTLSKNRTTVNEGLAHELHSMGDIQFRNHAEVARGVADMIRVCRHVGNCDPLEVRIAMQDRRVKHSTESTEEQGVHVLIPTGCDQLFKEARGNVYVFEVHCEASEKGSGHLVELGAYEGDRQVLADIPVVDSMVGCHDAIGSVGSVVSPSPNHGYCASLSICTFQDFESHLHGEVVELPYRLSVWEFRPGQNEDDLRGLP